MMHGRGVHIHSNGTTYIGDFINHKMHGNGVYVMPDGRRYDGEWINNKMDGVGIYEDSEGVRKREWRIGKHLSWPESNVDETVPQK
jgi:L1 cell adhesion molecule like protein